MRCGASRRSSTRRRSLTRCSTSSSGRTTTRTASGSPRGSPRRWATNTCPGRASAVVVLLVEAGDLEEHLVEEVRVGLLPGGEEGSDADEEDGRGLGRESGDDDEGRVHRNTMTTPRTLCFAARWQLGHEPSDLPKRTMSRSGFSLNPSTRHASLASGQRPSPEPYPSVCSSHLMCGGRLLFIDGFSFEHTMLCMSCNYGKFSGLAHGPPRDETGHAASCAKLILLG